MSGSAEELYASATFQCVQLKTLLHRCILFVLSHRYVVTNTLPQRCWKAVYGTGMGHRQGRPL